jgi:phage tail protein X
MGEQSPPPFSLDCLSLRVYVCVCHAVLKCQMAQNPSLVLNGSSCTNFQDRHSYCVQVPAAQPPSSPSPSPTPALTTTTTAQPHTTTTPSNGVATPTPTQPGISSSCDQFYFVQTGDTCDAIAQKYGTTAAAIESMNPGVGSDCTAMQASVYLCIALIDQPDKTTNNIQTPSPVQPGMVRDCDNFAYVSQGQTCAEVASANGISTQQFEAWNTGAGSGCASMWADVYACVGVTS